MATREIVAIIIIVIIIIIIIIIIIKCDGLWRIFQDNQKYLTSKSELGRLLKLSVKIS